VVGTDSPWTYSRLRATLCYVFRQQDVKRLFGRAVRLARSSRSLSQEQLAHDAGLDRSYVGGVERGDRNPSLVAIQKIARGLDIPLAELFAKVDGSGVPRSKSGQR